ncbi:hypothetical protein ACS0TY_015515 [Phlomoides rotata]
MTQISGKKLSHVDAGNFLPSTCTARFKWDHLYLLILVRLHKSKLVTASFPLHLARLVLHQNFDMIPLETDSPRGRTTQIQIMNSNNEPPHSIIVGYLLQFKRGDVESVAPTLAKNVSNACVVIVIHWVS